MAGYNGAAPLRPNTLQGYQKHHKFFQKLFDRSPNQEWINLAGAEMRDALIRATTAKKFSRKTAKSKYDQLKRVCRYAVAEGLASHDPTDGLEIKLASAEEKVRIAGVKLGAVYHPDEIRAMVAAADALCEDTSIDVRSRRAWADAYRPLLHVLIATGMRVGEVRALTRADVDSKKLRIRVMQAADFNNDTDAPKSANGVRSIPVTAKVIDPVNHALSKHRYSLVFPSAGGTVRADNVLRDFMLKPLCKKANVKNRGFHAFRHHFASRHIAEGHTPILQLSKWLGHHSPAFTMATYAHVFEDSENVEALDLTT